MRSLYVTTRTINNIFIYDLVREVLDYYDDPDLGSHAYVVLDADLAPALVPCDILEIRYYSGDDIE